MSTSPTTSTDADLPRLELVRHQLRMRRLEVRETSRPTPRLVRIGLVGEDLADFASVGPADHVKVFLPPPGEREPVVPELGPDGIVPGDGPRPVGRDYTPRHHRLDDGVLELDFVLHVGGRASAWADGARVGDLLAVGGPRGSHVPAGDFGGLLLVGDETALPAVQNWLRWAPAGLPVTALLDVQDAADVQPLPTAAALDVRWVERGAAGAGDGTALLAAVAELATPRTPTFCWIAGETDVARRVQRHLVDELAVPRDLVHSRGYWKRGTSDHQEPHAD